jgi:hypothetical protein
MTDSFSKRQGFRQVHETPITVRDDAPYDLRGVVVQLAYVCGFRPSTLRSLVCRVLRKRQDDNNWSEYPNIDGEVSSLVDDCEWYRFYDVVEAIAAEMHEAPFSFEPEKFATEMNDYFLENGIGWKLVHATLEMRGTELYEQTLRQAELELGSKGFSTALNEIHESNHDLSRRPTPDVTGAIQHSMAALECVARVCCGDEKSTLGEILKRYRDLIPKPLDVAVTKIWGFASENARHINEGREPTIEEAELVVTMVAGVSTYLSKKHRA